MGRRKSTESRMIALEILMELLPAWGKISPVKLNILIRDVLDKYDYMDPRDKALIKRLSEGCVERMITLDHVISLYSKTRIEKLKPVILNILRMGIYQIIYMDAVPDAAACNEAVNLTMDKGLQGLKGYVNGMLRTVAREKEKICRLGDDNTDASLSVRYSMPEWIVHMWRKRYDEETVIRMLENFQEPSEVTIRMRETLSGEQCAQWKEAVAGQGYGMTAHPYLPYAYSLKEVDGLAKLYGFKEGMFAVQDVSSMLAVELAGIEKGDHVVDICAAPGGKSMHAAEKTGMDGLIDARDISDRKLELIEENAGRLLPEMYGNGRIKISVHDAREPEKSLIGTADIVLADLPCSGLGVIGHKADIRYRMTKEQIKELAKLQREMLAAAVQYLKPAGILLYSTCTISEEENERNREWIIEHLSMEPVSIENRLPKELKGLTGKEGYLQLLPGIHKTDGFFVAKFKRVMK